MVLTDLSYQNVGQEGVFRGHIRKEQLGVTTDLQTKSNSRFSFLQMRKDYLRAVLTYPMSYR